MLVPEGFPEEMIFNWAKHRDILGKGIQTGVLEIGQCFVRPRNKGKPG